MDKEPNARNPKTILVAATPAESAGIKSILSQANPDLTIITNKEGVFGKDEIGRILERENVDTTIIDLQMRSTNGKELYGSQLAQLIRDGAMNIYTVLIVSDDYQNVSTIQAANAIANGLGDNFLLKPEIPNQLWDSVNGNSSDSHASVRQFLSDQAPISNGRETLSLTDRQSQILRHITLGMSTDAIAKSLGLSPQTVNKHIQNIFLNIGVSDRTQAATFAISTFGLLPK